MHGYHSNRVNKHWKKMSANDDKSTEFQIRPPLAEKFKSMAIREIIRTVLTEELTGKTYAADLCESWTRQISDTVRTSVKELNLKRYKIIVQAILGENRGSGVKIGTRCLWDADTDNYASDSFINDSLFCNVVVYGIYCY